MDAKDEIAGLRAQAKHFRELAAINRKAARAAKDCKAWVEAIKAQSRVDEYVLAAQQRDRLARELRGRI
ncbi:hypothetical protein [Paraburkholderia domus]|uniref:hypothetical protein n=1 Tax=Paraburkholderia domus TaxID=2793075 RepID=UPI001914832D|nr:hypothetical protein [Paraburkholderia domus]MBK5061760.1 hypothetical protein [Burkholderia sp. R-70199]